MHNSHVLKYMRWKIWLSMELGRPLAHTFWAQWYNDELAKCEPLID